jgi:hypothetical protein
MSNSNAMTAHLWAQRDKPSARSSNGNLSFDGPTLYSYTTPIGRFVDVPGRGDVVLVTSQSYSVTTSGKHMPALYRALREGGPRRFTVPNLGSYYSGPAKSEHEENLEHLLSEYRDSAARVQRMRDYYGNEEGLTATLRELADVACDYAELFDLPRPGLNPEEAARRVFEARATREAKHNTPAAIAKREKRRERREALAARRDELARAESVERIAAWRNGEPVQLRHGEAIGGAFGERGTALLRVKGDKLETSLGASVPLDHAVRVFRFVKLCRERGEGWQRNGRSLRVGHFQVDSVEPNGDFRAGCHFIAWAETEAAARQAGVADVAPEDTRDVPVAA